MTATAFKDRLNTAEVIEPEPPRPLRRGLRAGDPYPLSALGDVIASAVKGTQDLIQAPVEICAQSALAHAALAVQAHANVVLPTGHADRSHCFYCPLPAPVIASHPPTRN